MIITKKSAKIRIFFLVEHFLNEKYYQLEMFIFVYFCRLKKIEILWAFS